MFELSLNQRKLKCDFNLQLVNAFKEPIVFYLMDKRDKRSFFLSFVIVDASKQEVIFLDAYSKDNLDIYNRLKSDEQFVLKRTPHRSVVVVTGKKFYTFVQDERFFFCVDCSSLKMQVMTLDERIGDKNYKIQKISASIFYDYYNNNYLYISAIDTEQNLHIYHASIDLQEIVEIYTEKGHRTTPHSIVNYKNHLYLSHDFGNVDFRNKRKNEISNSDQIVEGLDMQVIKKRIMNRNTNSSEKEMREEVVKEFFNDKNYEVERGKIALLDLNTFQMKTYNTSGASPAHFEFDFEKDYIYIVSHNFFGWEGRNIFISPAIIDKFKITDDGLVLLNRFSYAKGFRYATHKLFYRDKKCYICTMAQPNRLIVVDASTMKLVFYYDIGEDKLSDKNNVRDYLNSNNSHDEIVAVLASKDGNYLVLISNIYIYYFDIEKRSIAQKIKYNEEGKDWVIRTVHKDIIRYISKTYGNFVVALARSKQPIICDKEGIPYYNEDYVFRYGVADVIIKSSSNYMIAIGGAFGEAYKACNCLNKKGIDVGLIYISTPLSIDKQLRTILANKNVFVFEEHNEKCGLYKELAEFICRYNICCSMYHVGLKDYGESGDYNELLEKNGLDANSIQRYIEDKLETSKGRG